MSRIASRSFAISLTCLCILDFGLQLPAAKAQSQFDVGLNTSAQSYLDTRTSTVEKLETRAEVEARTKRFREFVLGAIGGLPSLRAPLNATIVRTLDEDGFDVQAVIYDSLPGFHVTANFYLPKSGQAPFPAVIYTPGHYPAGKYEAWSLASNMARNGIAVLAYDPVGEGERLQYFDPKIKKSMAGQPTGEHSEASVQIALTGDQISRYFLWDAMRGIDYLASRQDIDAKRIGALGCSGGGTVTAYLAALDPRIKAAGVACYITSFKALLGSIGPQEAEQTIPGFIAHGFDFPDWIEAAAPIPYAVISTTEDMFPFEGARASVEEARRVYGLYGAAANLEWITGPGRHGNLRPVYSEIVKFFLERLGRSDEAPNLTQLDEPPVAQLQCTDSGQVSESLPGETLFSLNRTAAQTLLHSRKSIRSSSDLAVFREHVAQEVRTMTGAVAQPGVKSPQVSLEGSTQRNGYLLQTATLTTDTGEVIAGALAIPSQPGRKPVVLLLEDPSTGDVAREGGELDRLAASGKIVFAPQLPPAAPDRTAPKSALLGPFYLDSLRAQLVGGTLVGLRVDDAIRCVDWLSALPDGNPAKISGRASGAMGIVLLHTAALDPRIRDVQVDRTLISYRNAVESPLTRNLAQSVIPGVLRHYDLDDLVMAIAPRPVSLISPVAGNGNSIEPEAAQQALGWVLRTDRALGHPGRVKLIASDPDVLSRTDAAHISVQ